MYQLVSKLIVYREFGEDSMLSRLAKITEDFHDGAPKHELTTRIFAEVKRILDLATEFGFDDNLWQNYLTFLLITNKNSFTLTAEKVGSQEGSVNHFVKNDYDIFRQLFVYDFSALEEALDIDCFTTLCNYHAIIKKERMYNLSVSEKVRTLSQQLAAAKDVDAFFDILTGFYADFGFGMFGLNRAFRLRDERAADGSVDIYPINNTENVSLDDLVGYEWQKQRLIENTEAFVDGKPANNCLLYGDSGTGKSTCIKAIINQYYNRGLRMIEIYKHQFKDLNAVISTIKNRNYRFIIYMDDLSFEEFETEYKFLKAVIEGGVEMKPDNILIYATSNRRHLIKETWGDRENMEIHGEIHTNDSIQEKLSLVNRFGETINFSKPNRIEYHQIVVALAKRIPSIQLDEKELLLQADQWEMSHGGISGRTAQQFVNHLAGLNQP
ncbi:MAG: ATP-binding protein [Lachnospiraceae bacterium]|nr:ATP-binding protein [Lachnospiraceae bacterium]